MGMYAEINVCFDLTKGTPKNVVDVLYYLIDDNDKPSDLPNHEFFKCDRWDMVACCDSYYFDGMTNSKIKLIIILPHPFQLLYRNLFTQF